MLQRWVGNGLAALIAIIFSSAVAGAQQSGPVLIERALSKYEANVENVDTYLLVTEVLGIETEQRMRKEIVGGSPIFVPVGTSSDSLSTWRNPYTSFRQVADRARFAGTEQVAGNACHLVEIDDFEGVDFNAEVGADQDFVPEYMALCLDTDDSLLRQMRFRGTLDVDGTAQPVTFVATFSDYRNTGGMEYPWKTTIVAEGLIGPNAQISEEELAEAQQAMADLEEQMAEMSDREREMMERVMGPQLDRMREMVASGQFKSTLTVKRLEVNVPID